MAKVLHYDKPDFAEMVAEDAAKLTAEWIGFMAEQMPLESEYGQEHTIEALLAAVRQVGGNEAQEVQSAFQDRASGDNTAAASASVTHSEGSTSVGYDISIDLNFMAVMDQGGTLRPISPGGIKSAGEDTVGVLYASRSGTGIGMLMWYDPSNPRAGASGRVYAPYRTYSGMHFVEHAADDVTLSALELGYVRK